MRASRGRPVLTRASAFRATTSASTARRTPAGAAVPWAITPRSRKNSVRRLGGLALSRALHVALAAHQRQAEPQPCEEPENERRDGRRGPHTEQERAQHKHSGAHRESKEGHAADRQAVGRAQHLLFVDDVAPPVEPVIDRWRHEERARNRRAEKATEVRAVLEQTHPREAVGEGYRQKKTEEKLHAGKGDADLVQKLGPFPLELGCVLLGRHVVKLRRTTAHRQGSAISSRSARRSSP